MASPTVTTLDTFTLPSGKRLTLPATTVKTPSGQTLSVPVLPKGSTLKITPKVLSTGSRTVAPRGTQIKVFTPSAASIRGGTRSTTTTTMDTTTTTTDTTAATTATTDTAATTAPVTTETVLTDTSRLTVTSMPTGSEGSVWTEGGAQYPTGEASTLPTTPTELVTSDVQTVSAAPAAATGVAGFLSTYKWWIVGGVGGMGVYAYLHRTSPTTFPLPGAISKWVRG